MNDPMTILKKDHREVRMLLSQLADSDPGQQRERLLSELEQQLELHMEIEERLIYPLVREWSGEEQAEEAEIEHGLAREGLQQARAMLDVPGFGAAAEMLRAGIVHHIREEEQELLPALKQEMSRDDWRELGDRVAEAKQAAAPSGRRG